MIDQWKAEKTAEHQAKMPNKPKDRIVATGEINKRWANVGNLLHSHRTVEDHLQELIRRKRWD